MKLLRENWPLPCTELHVKPLCKPTGKRKHGTHCVGVTWNALSLPLLPRSTRGASRKLAGTSEWLAKRSARWQLQPATTSPRSTSAASSDKYGYLAMPET